MPKLLGLVFLTRLRSRGGLLYSHPLRPHPLCASTKGGAEGRHTSHFAHFIMFESGKPFAPKKTCWERGVPAGDLCAGSKGWCQGGFDASDINRVCVKRRIIGLYERFPRDVRERERLLDPTRGFFWVAFFWQMAEPNPRTPWGWVLEVVCPSFLCLFLWHAVCSGQRYGWWHLTQTKANGKPE